MAVEVLAGLQLGDPSAQVDVGLRLAGEQKVKAVKQGLAAERLMGVEIIAPQGPVVRGRVRGLSAQPAFGRVDFAVLFLLAVLGGDELRSQGDDLLVGGTEDDRGERAVVMSDVSVGMMTAGSVGAGDALGLGGKKTGAIQGDQLGLVHRPHGLEQPLLIEGLIELIKEDEHMLGGDRVQAVTDMIVGGDALDLKEALGVGGALVCFHRLAEARKEGIDEKKEREGRQEDVAHGELGVAPVRRSGNAAAHWRTLSIRASKRIAFTPSSYEGNHIKLQVSIMLKF